MKQSLPNYGIGRAILLSCLCCFLTFTGLWAQAPANDQCVDAITINVCDLVSGSTTGATVETGITYAGFSCDAPAPNDAEDAGIWYAFTAPAHPIAITATADYEIELGLLAGNCTGLLCQDVFVNGGGDMTATIGSTTLIDGDQYFIYVEVILLLRKWHRRCDLGHRRPRRRTPSSFLPLEHR
ncbi:MAG: hypothetical protein AAFU03_14585 [Bacteroidota bacterium]